jgi:hypothetical protein
MHILLIIALVSGIWASSEVIVDHHVAKPPVVQAQK